MKKFIQVSIGMCILLFYNVSIAQIEKGMAVASCSANQPEEMVIGVEDIRRPSMDGGVRGRSWDYLGSNKAPMQSEPDWIRKEIGQIFGVALGSEASPDIFASSTDIYTAQSFGKLGHAALYRLRIGGGLLNGGYEVFHDFADPKRKSGLGQVAYNLNTKTVYVSDFETGLITVLRDNGAGSVGTSLGSFDHGVARQYFMPAGLGALKDDGEPGPTNENRLVWGLQVHHLENRLYYGLGRVDEAGAIGEEIWSVALDVNGLPDPTTVVREFRNTSQYHRVYGISDIAFSVDHSEMIITERGNIANGYNAAHNARALEYSGLNSGSWIFVQELAAGGLASDQNSAGGVDYAYGYNASESNVDLALPDTSIALSANAMNLLLPSNGGLPRAYGFHVANRGNSNLPFTLNDYLLIDLDGVSGTSVKNQLGDVEIFRDRVPQETQQCLADASFEKVECGDENNQYTAVLNFENTSPFGTPATEIMLTPKNQGVTIFSPANGNQNFNPALQVGQTASIPIVFDAEGYAGQEVCFDAKLLNTSADDWCCPGQEVCVTLPVCQKDCIEKMGIKCTNGNCQLDFNNTGPTDIYTVHLSSPTGSTFTPSTFTGPIASGDSGSFNFTVSPVTSSAVVELKGKPFEDTPWTEFCCSQIVTWINETVPVGPTLPSWIRIKPDFDNDGRADRNIDIASGTLVEFEQEGNDRLLSYRTGQNGMLSPSTTNDSNVILGKIRMTDETQKRLKVSSNGPFVSEFAKVTLELTANPVIVLFK